MDSLQQRIKDIYEDSGYRHIGETASGLKFSNAFSRHFVFVLPDLTGLENKWSALHDEVVQEYLDFTGEPFIEWNFYCVFILAISEITEPERTSFLAIEQDRSYSRKYVRLMSEIETLPPGRISVEDWGEKESVTGEMSELWKDILGDQLYKAIMNDSKKNIEKRLLKLLEEYHE